MNRAEYDEAVSKCPNHPHDDGPFRYCAVKGCPWTERGWKDPDAWKPRYIVQKASGVGGEPIAPDEPVLVIRAQDVLAEEMMQFYIGSYYDLEGKDPAVEADLRAHLAELRRWRAVNSDRIKVADRSDGDR